MQIPKSDYDPNGLEFEIALMKARYVYPEPENPSAKSIEKHAIQIYESEMVERSLCEQYECFRPVTYRNVCEYFDGSKRDKLLHKQSPYVMVKDKLSKRHIRQIFEYSFEFLDIFHVPTLSVIECKVYKSDAGLERHKSKIRSRRNSRRGVMAGDELNDYYLLCKDNETEFLPEWFLSVNESGQFVKHDFGEFIESGIK